MRMMSIASGSSGNAVYVGTDDTHLLVDTGISMKRIEEGLKKLELTGRDISGILISHEHSDHVSGIGPLLRKYHIPVYATEGTINAVLRSSSVGKLDRELFNTIKSDSSFYLGDIKVMPFATSHDAAEPVMFSFKVGNVKTAVATDLGEYDAKTVAALNNLKAVYLEANHDIKMLQTGPYPYPLKQRILGKRGHLSNETAGRLLAEILNDKTEYVFLSHLSKENNLPELAYEAVRLEVNMSETPYRAEDFRLMIARRDEPSECINL